MYYRPRSRQYKHAFRNAFLTTPYFNFPVVLGGAGTHGHVPALMSSWMREREQRERRERCMCIEFTLIRFTRNACTH